MSTSKYIVSDFLITVGSINDATSNSSHIMDHMDVPAGGCASRYTCFTCALSGPPAFTIFPIKSALDHTCSPASYGLITISFHGSRITMEAASGSHHQFSSGPPRKLPPMM